MKRIHILLVLLMVCMASVSHAQQDLNAATRTLLDAAEYPDEPEAFNAALEALAAGADVNAKEWGDQTVLMVATKYCNLKMVQLLLDRGANIEAQANDGETALMLAAKKGSPFPAREGRSGYTEILMTLLKQGARVNVRDAKGKSALYWAAAYGHADHVKLLLAKGADVNVVGIDVPWTPLISASYYGHTEVVRLLLQARADTLVRDRDGQTALSYASQQGHTEIARLLSTAATEDPRGSGAVSGGGWGGHPVHVEDAKPVSSRPVVTEKQCYLCNGGGACTWCYGSGRSSMGDYACVKCYGSGRCTNCGGSGRVRN